MFLHISLGTYSSTPWCTWYWEDTGSWSNRLWSRKAIKGTAHMIIQIINTIHTTTRWSTVANCWASGLVRVLRILTASLRRHVELMQSLCLMRQKDCLELELTWGKNVMCVIMYTVLTIHTYDGIYLCSTSTDRYANVDVGVLLYHIERFPGIVILTTNLIDNIDKAFFRRLKFVFLFEGPPRALRERLWKVDINSILHHNIHLLWCDTCSTV